MSCRQPGVTTREGAGTTISGVGYTLISKPLGLSGSRGFLPVAAAVTGLLPSGMWGSKLADVQAARSFKVETVEKHELPAERSVYS